MLNLCYAAFLTFTNTILTHKFLPNTPMGTVTKMVSGIDAMIMRPNAELIKLAKLAIENDVDSVILKPLKAAECLKELERDDPRKVLAFRAGKGTVSLVPYLHRHGLVSP